MTPIPTELRELLERHILSIETHLAITLEGALGDSTAELRALLAAQPQASYKVPCKTHQDAPHGFCRNSSHTAGRYVCECEHWEEPQASVAQSAPAGEREAVVVVAYLDAHDCLWNETTHPDRMIPLMTVAQHERIVAAFSAQQSKPSTVTRDQIRDVFMRNGFTIKEGQTDLKPYVYAAAEELLSIARASRQHTQSAPVSQAERLPLESLEPLHRPVPSGWAVKRSDASRHELYGFYDEYLGPLDGWLQDPRRAVLFGNKEAAIAAQAALSVDSKLAISVVWLVYDPVFDTYREQAQ